MIRHAWSRATVAMLITVAFGGIVFANIDVQNDWSFFQPRAPSRISELAIEQVRSGPASRLVLVGIDGAPSTDIARLSRLLAETLSKSSSFSRVSSGANELDEGALQILFKDRYLLGPDISRDEFAPEELRRSIASALGRLGSLSGYALGDLLPADPTGRSQALIKAWQGSSQPHYKHGVWFSRDETMALMLVATAAHGDDQLGQTRAQQEIEANFSGIVGASGANLVMTGPPVISLAVSQSIQNEAWWIGIGSIVIVTALLVVTFRSGLLLLAIALPTAVGAIAGALAVQLLFGSVHGIALTFGGTLAGVTSDYPVHLISHLRRGSTPKNELRRIWSPLALGAGITAAAFLPMTISSFPGLAQLGVIAAVGVVGGMLATALVLPWILEFHPTGDVIGWSHSLVPLFARGKVAAVAAGVAGLAWLAIDQASLFSDDLSRLNPLPQRLVELDKRIRGELGAPDVRRLFLIDGKSAEEVLLGSERISIDLQNLAQEGSIGSYDAPSRYLPSIAVQRARQARLPSEEELRFGLSIAVRDLPVDTATFEPFIRDIAAAKARTPIEPPELLPVPLVGDRLASLLSRRADGTWVAFILLSGVARPDRLSEIAHQVGGDSTHYLDLQTESIHVIASYRTDALRWLVGGLAVVFLVLFVALSVRRAVQVSLSLVASLSLTAAILVAMGMPLTPFHLMSLLLVAGMGLDFAVFLSRDDVDTMDLQQTLRSIVICAVTTVIPFGLMVASSAPILRGIGLTVAIGVTLSSLTALAICGGRTRAVS